MKRPVAIATKTNRAVRVSIGFVIVTAAIVALFGAAAVASRLLN